MNLPDDVALRVTNLSKRYRKAGSGEDFWALKDLNFEIKKGEYVGIVGNNGAGKSTLLRLLSGINKPTTGNILFSGKIASILDIGTGFHPELTGMQNIYLSGALRGFSKKQINARLQEIIEFSGIGNFIKEPVKSYSSGMFIRLAFSTTMLLEADCYLFDEALGAGDTEFRDKIRNAFKERLKGKTVLSVSHNLKELYEVADKIILIEKGKLVAAGSKEILSEYFLDSKSATSENKKTIAYQLGQKELADYSNEKYRLLNLSVTQNTTPAGEHLDIDTPFKISLRFEKLIPGETLDFGFRLIDHLGYSAGTLMPHRAGLFFQETGTGTFEINCVMPGEIMNLGIYYIDIVSLLNRNELLHHHQAVTGIRIINNKVYDQSFTFEYAHSAVFPVLKWELKKV